jgi:beta-glucanase (GH16 family)
MDWTPGLTTWHADGREVRSQSFQAPVDPSRIVLNAWSDGERWTGEMGEGGQAFQDIQWIEMAYNLADEGACSRVCSVDGGHVGSPAPVQGKVPRGNLVRR